MDEFGADDDLDPAPIPYSAAYTNITSISCTIEANEYHTQAMAGFEAAYLDKIHQFDDESESEDVSLRCTTLRVQYASKKKATYHTVTMVHSSKKNG